MVGCCCTGARATKIRTSTATGAARAEKMSGRTRRQSTGEGSPTPRISRPSRKRCGGGFRCGVARRHICCFVFWVGLNSELNSRHLACGETLKSGTFGVGRKQPLFSLPSLEYLRGKNRRRKHRLLPDGVVVRRTLFFVPVFGSLGYVLFFVLCFVEKGARLCPKSKPLVVLNRRLYTTSARYVA